MGRVGHVSSPSAQRSTSRVALPSPVPGTLTSRTVRLSVVGQPRSAARGSMPPRPRSTVSERTLALAGFGHRPSSLSPLTCLLCGRCLYMKPPFVSPARLEPSDRSHDAVGTHQGRARHRRQPRRARLLHRQGEPALSSARRSSCVCRRPSRAVATASSPPPARVTRPSRVSRVATCVDVLRPHDAQMLIRSRRSSNST